MKLLLDTHTFIFFINGSKRLSQKAKQAIINPSNSNFISIVSIWEMAIKVSLGKLKINHPFREVFNQIEENRFEILPVVFEHTIQVSQLEFHHRDPFDRLLIAQAMSEGMTIISKDDNFHSYELEILW